MLKSLLKSRYATLFSFIGYYIIASFLVRLILTLLSFSAISDSLGQVLAAFFIGLSFDISVAFCFSIVYSLYLLFFPSKFVGSFIDKVLSYIIISLMFFITLFSFAAEFPFGMSSKPVSTSSLLIILSILMKSSKTSTNHILFRLL